MFDSIELLGIITPSDLIKCLPGVPETDVKVDDFMTKDIVRVDEKCP